MTQEEKELLLKDLCARLPYGVKGFVEHGVFKGIVTLRNINIDNDCQPIACYNDYSSLHVKVSEFKPYLFPLSSMTKEQEEEFKNLYYRYHESAFIFNERFSYDRWSIKDIGFYPCYLQDWLNKNYFDYRNLIPKGLAKDATGLNIY